MWGMSAQGVVRGYLAHNKPPPTLDPTVGLCLRPYGGARGGCVRKETPNLLGPR